MTNIYLRRLLVNCVLGATVGFGSLILFVGYITTLSFIFTSVTGMIIFHHLSVWFSQHIVGKFFLLFISGFAGAGLYLTSFEFIRVNFFPYANSVGVGTYISIWASGLALGVVMWVRANAVRIHLSSDEEE
jgi:hypothetical protein